MSPPLRQWYGWRATVDSGVALPSGRQAMARGAVWFSILGVVVALASIALPHNPGMDERALAGVALATAVLFGIAALGYDSLPEWAFWLGTAIGSGLATAAVHYWGGDSLYGPLAYLWPALFAFWFFSGRMALAQTLLIGALFALELAGRDLGYTPIAPWVATMGTIAGAGLLVAAARDRSQAAIARLSDAARRDPLTGLLNRRGFEEAFDVELERARRTEQSLSLIVGDLDRFKDVNDTHGHPAGDDVLRKVGELFMASKRSWDAAARVGGEEFAILAPDTDEHGAYILAERMRTSVEAAFADSPPGLTASFGIVSYPVHGQIAATLMRAGDQALYAAKKLGRNRSVISSAEVPGILARAPRGQEASHVELATLLSLAEALDVRDSGSATHCRRVSRYAELIAREMAMPPDSVERVRIAGILHDVGRVGVPDRLLTKDGPLNEEEWHWMRSHPEIGARMLDTTDFADMGEWILAHHERPDGMGYPEGRGAGEVPLEAAILGVADAYEAMTARRPYRPPLDPQAASEELRRGAGRQFDEQVVDALLRVV
jgi:diguanylate cyclase (GGDEF)-like protein